MRECWGMETVTRERGEKCGDEVEKEIECRRKSRDKGVTATTREVGSASMVKSRHGNLEGE